MTMQLRFDCLCIFSFFQSYGIVFVVDASDEDRLEECKKILHETEMQPRVAGKPLLM